MHFAFYFVSLRHVFINTFYQHNLYMMMKKLLLSMMLMLAWMGAARATEVTIGGGTSTSYSLPFNMWYNYSLTQQIYTAEELGGAGTITSI